jgi:hypothetical protein
MIRYIQGNLLDAPVEALVNTVNENGVMGKGIALQFKEAFPENTKAYEQACKREEVRVGHMFAFQNSNLFGPHWIINFPTKKHWRFPSRMEWILDGLKDLVRFLKEYKINSIAIPPLGCGNGGLLIYEPVLAYQNAPKREGLEMLTPARALIAELVRRYLVLGIDCTNLEVQKLGWFLQRVIQTMDLTDPLHLQFAANKYGPYADNLRHLLNGLDGSFLHCERRLSEAGPMEPIWFEDSKKSIVAEFLHSDAAREYLPALEKTSRLIDGFESPLGMELLATVDWLLSQERCEPSLQGLRDGLDKWPGGHRAALRKSTLFEDRLLDLALTRLSTRPI